MKNYRLSLVSLLFLGLFTSPLSADEAELSQEQIARLIADLGNVEFTIREAATQRLKEVGAPAIAPLTEAALRDNLETTNRALQILVSFYDKSDESLLDVLDTSLEQLADSKNASASRRARAAIALHAKGRHERAFRKVVRLGGMMPEPRIDAPYPDLQFWIDDKWTGGEEGLKYFRRLVKLRAIYRIEGCPVSAEAVHKLEQIVPNMTVQGRGASCLGLGPGEPRERGFQIINVMEAGSVYSAGLRNHDVITKYDEKEVNNFEQLVELIKENKPGDVVEVEYLRGNQTLTADVKLKSWREYFEDDQQKKREQARNPIPSQEPVPVPIPVPQPKPANP